MTRYLEILAEQRPFPFNVDENGRTMFSFNLSALAAAPVAEFEGEMAALLVSGGVAAGLGQDIFVGPASVAPQGSGPYVTIIDTGGRRAEEAHGGERYERLSAQIVTRALEYEAGRATALAAWRALDGVRNVTVVAA